MATRAGRLAVEVGTCGAAVSKDRTLAMPIEPLGAKAITGAEM